MTRLGTATLSWATRASLVALAACIADAPPTGPGAPQADPAPELGEPHAPTGGGRAFVTLVRVIEPGELGLAHPAGLAFSPHADMLLVVSRVPGAPAGPVTDVALTTLAEDRVGAVRIAAGLSDPVTLTFDARANRLLGYEAARQELFAIAADGAGRLDPQRLRHFDAARFGVRDARGMTVDPASGRLFILDAVGGGPRIVRVDPDPRLDFAAPSVSVIDLAATGWAGLRGLAFDPTSGHLHVLDAGGQVLHELTETGRLVATRDLSRFALRTPQGMTFGPSGDATDDPSELSLYVAESGAAAGDEGQIVELSFVEPMAVAAVTVTGTLVRTIQTSQFSPPSPDPSGITYATHLGRLVIVDGEVEEMRIYAGANVFEATTAGSLVRTWTTTSFSNEPVGAAYNPANRHLFVSDDNRKEIFEVDAGADGLYGSADDVRRSFVMDATTDPEGVAFDVTAGVLFVADGLNSEVHRISPGANSVFDGAPPAGDDVISHFDTEVLGLTDPEGIAYDADFGHLYVVGKPETLVFHMTATGMLLRTIDISAANAIKPAGLEYAPGSQNPNIKSLWIVDRAVDNNTDSRENDGKLYEFAVPSLPGNTAPTVTITAPANGAAFAHGDSVTFTGTAGDLQDGDLTASLAWTSSRDGALGSGGTVSTIALTAGAHTITAFVTDNGGLADSAAISVTVIPPPNQAPTAAFGQTCAELTCQFVDQSVDSDGAVVAWSWRFGDGSTTTIRNPSHAYLTDGTYDVTLIVTDDAGARDTTSHPVTVSVPNQPPIAAFAHSCAALACAFTDQSSDVDGAIVAWSWSFGDGTSATTSNPSHTYGAGGTYTVTLTVTDNRGGTGTTSRAVSVNAAPVAAFTESCVALTCGFTDQSSDPDGSIVAWSWAFGDGTTSTTSNPSHTYSGGGTYTVTLTVTDAGGAAATASHPVVVNAPPVAAFTASCALLACTFTDQSADADGGVVAWSWSFGDGTTSTARNPSHTYAVGGSYSVTLTVTDDDGATASTGHAVTANAAPVAAFTQSCTLLVCAFTDQSSDPDGSVVAWSWAFGDGTTSTTPNASHTYSGGGTYTVTLTVTDAGGATASTSRAVTPNAPPVAAFAASCTLLACTFTDQSGDSDGSVVAWSWSFGDGTTSTTSNPSHSYSVGGTYTVTLTVTDDDGAAATSSQPVVANTPPVAAFTESCVALTCSFSDHSTDPDGTIVAWSWRFGDGLTSSARNPSHTYAAGATYTVTLSVTDNRGGTATTSHAVTPNAPPIAAFSQTCTGVACAFTDRSSDTDGSLASWSWSFGDGTTSTTSNPSHTYSGGGTYTVTLTVTDDDGATGTTSKVLTLTAPPNSPPVAAFVASCGTLVCSFADQSTDSDGVVAGWSWNFGDGTTSTVSTPSHTYAAGGSYTVTLTVTDDDGATDATTRSVSVNGPPTAAYGQTCANLACTFTDQSVDSDGSVVAWSWSFGDGTTSTTSSPSHTYSAGGTYTVTLRVADDDGATAMMSKSVTVNAPPVAGFTQGCAALACTFTDTSTDSDGTIVAWSWSFGDGTTATTANPSHTYAAGGSYGVTLTVTDDRGATAAVSGSVTVNAPPAAAFTHACSGPACSFTDQSADSDGSVVAWSWNFGDGTTSTASDPSHTYAAGGSYTVTLSVTDDDGATATTSRAVAASVPPVAAFIQTCVNLVCEFSDRSTDPDGSIVAWSWHFGDGMTSTTANPSHTYAAGGSYTVSLTVTDDHGAQTAATGPVTVNAPPAAAFVARCLGPLCHFTDTSSDPDGTVNAWAWTFGDGTTASVPNPVHEYAAPGTHEVTLTLTDDQGGTGSATAAVTTTAPTMSLTVTGTKARDFAKVVDLSWSPVSTGSVDVYRDGVRVATLPDAGVYRDEFLRRGTATYRYQVCTAGSTTACSGSVVVTL